jgi:hypothetical protein
MTQQTDKHITTVQEGADSEPQAIKEVVAEQREKAKESLDRLTLLDTKKCSDEEIMADILTNHPDINKQTLLKLIEEYNADVVVEKLHTLTGITEQDYEDIAIKIVHEDQKHLVVENIDKFKISDIYKFIKKINFDLSSLEDLVLSENISEFLNKNPLCGIDFISSTIDSSLDIHHDPDRSNYKAVQNIVRSRLEQFPPRTYVNIATALINGGAEDLFFDNFDKFNNEFDSNDRVKMINILILWHNYFTGNNEHFFFDLLDGVAPESHREVYQFLLDREAMYLFNRDKFTGLSNEDIQNMIGWCEKIDRIFSGAGWRNAKDGNESMRCIHDHLCNNSSPETSAKEGSKMTVIYVGYITGRSQDDELDYWFKDGHEEAPDELKEDLKQDVHHMIVHDGRWMKE